MTYEIRMEGVFERIEADTLEDAIEQAEAWAIEGWEPEQTTTWVHATMYEVGEDGEIVESACEYITATIEPDEPQCRDNGQHDWQSPHDLVGGLEENPGVQGHGGGVTIQEVCMRCGCGRLTDTWAQDSFTGQQGLESVTYEPGKYEIPGPLPVLHELADTYGEDTVMDYVSDLWGNEPGQMTPAEAIEMHARLGWKDDDYKLRRTAEPGDTVLLDRFGDRILVMPQEEVQ